MPSIYKHIYLKFIDGNNVIFNEKINIGNDFDRAKNIFDKLGTEYQLCKIHDGLHVEASIDPAEVLFQNFVIKYLYPICENLKTTWENFDIEFVYFYLPIEE